MRDAWHQHGSVSFLDEREELATPIPYAPREREKGALREELAAPIPLLPQGSLQNI